ncbi:hypothetical protein BGZ46_008440 [Entomortierella lignicola]|nr:hypothetical protein BGZ46_008440 [Entomortierella lignicola]
MNRLQTGNFLRFRPSMNGEALAIPLRRSSKPGAEEIEEVDGVYLHKHLVGKATYSLKYDETLVTRQGVRHSERSIVGQFTCTFCRPENPRIWRSGVISTELWFAGSSNRYRTLLHSQKCRKCERYAEPEVDIDNYVKKVISAFDLWKGKRRAIDYEKREITAPHDRQRCHGCAVGVCSRKDQ